LGVGHIKEDTKTRRERGKLLQNRGRDSGPERERNEQTPSWPGKNALEMPGKSLADL